MPDERAACEDARKHDKKSFKAIQSPQGMICSEKFLWKAMNPSVQPTLVPGILVH